MKIAFACEEMNGLDSTMSHHFGRCPAYTYVELDENQNVIKAESEANPFAAEHAPGMVPNYIAKQKADVMISGGMGARAVDFFNQLGIEAVTGAAGKVRDVLEEYLKGELKGYKPCNESVAHSEQ